MNDDSLIIKLGDCYAFKNHEGELNVPMLMVEDLKAKMSYNDAIMCYINSLFNIKEYESIVAEQKLQIKKLEEDSKKLKKIKKYMKSCILPTETEHVILDIIFNKDKK